MSDPRENCAGHGFDTESSRAESYDCETCTEGDHDSSSGTDDSDFDADNGLD
jgi:hypothetical protein